MIDDNDKEEQMSSAGQLPPLPNMDKARWQYPLEWKQHWEAPKRSDPDYGTKLLALNNIPFPLQGPGCQPRTIVGPTAWNYMRRKCYQAADYHCEICGRECHSYPDWGQYNAHEVFSVDYTTGEEKFEGLVCACRACHLTKVHTGRALTLYKKGAKAYDKKALLTGAEEAFRQVYEWNKAHPDEKPIRLFYTWLSYVDEPVLHDEMVALLKKYPVGFWCPDKENSCKWGDWKLVYHGKEYKTPYKDVSEWEKAMEKNNEKQKALWSKSYPGQDKHVEELRALLEERRRKKRESLDKSDKV